MADDPTCGDFRAGTPFRRVWPDLGHAERPVALRFWIDHADHDAWAFDQLCDLGAALIESGMTPQPPLDSFLARVLRREISRPKATRSDARRDYRIALAVRFIQARKGVSQREACKTAGEIFRLSSEAIHHALRRGEGVSDS